MGTKQIRTKRTRTIVLFSIACMLAVLATGCSLGPAASGKTSSDQAGGALQGESDGAQPAEDAAGAGNVADTEKQQENDEGKWHVLDPEVADTMDADFLGVVWKVAEGAFSIAEVKVSILEDGSIASSGPASNAPIPDSQLIHVVVDDDTYFYVRTIYGSGESYEDVEAGFQDLEEHMSVELKGRFENDVFYATEIRMVKFS